MQVNGHMEIILFISVLSALPRWSQQAFPLAGVPHHELLKPCLNFFFFLQEYVRQKIRDNIPGSSPQTMRKKICTINNQTSSTTSWK
jgi:hypothetical protein